MERVNKILDGAATAPTFLTPRGFSLSLSRVKRGAEEKKEDFPKRISKTYSLRSPIKGGDIAALGRALQYDYVDAKLKDGIDSKGRSIHCYRKTEYFSEANVTTFDLDNGHSDDPDDWVTPEAFRNEYPDVEFYAVFSYSHMKGKGGKTPRPCWHGIFPHRPIKDAREYRIFKNTALGVVTYRGKNIFDDDALDIVRLLYGAANAAPVYYPGKMDIIDLVINKRKEAAPIGETPAAPVQDDATPSKKAQGREVTSPPTNTPPPPAEVAIDEKSALESEASGAPPDCIPQGRRNSVLSAEAFRVLKRWGDDEGKARAAYDDTVKLCAPPLPIKEVEDIWREAVNAYHCKVKNKAGYIDPKVFEPNNTAQAETEGGEGAFDMAEENIDGVDDGEEAGKERTRFYFYTEEYSWVCKIEDAEERARLCMAVLDYMVFVKDYWAGVKTPPPMGERAQLLYDLCKDRSDRDYKKYLDECKRNAVNGKKGADKRWAK